MELVEARWDQRIVRASVYRHVGLLVDEVDAESVPRFHEGVEIGTGRMKFNPARMIIWSWSFDTSY